MHNTTAQHAAATAHSGFAKINGCKIAYFRCGPRFNRRAPLLVLHGGPGYPHDYLAPLSRLAQDGRTVIFYDQLGCGDSQKPSDASAYRIGTYTAELAGIRSALALDRVHLLGHSWGAMLALEYMVDCRPEGVESLTLASGLADTQSFVCETRRLLSEMDPMALSRVIALESEGKTESPEYQKINAQFLARHMIRGKRPACMTRASQKSGDVCYAAMWGASEFSATGNLKNWSVWEKLPAITCPTLITCGRYDESTPRLNKRLQRAIGGSALHVFARSAHMSHLEQTDQYLRVLKQFLSRVER